MSVLARLCALPGLTAVIGPLRPGPRPHSAADPYEGTPITDKTRAS